MVLMGAMARCRASGGRRRIWSVWLRFFEWVWVEGGCVPAWSEQGSVWDSDWLLSLLVLRTIPSLTSPIRVPHRPSLVPVRGLGQIPVPSFFRGFLASSGHRGRDDARGRPTGWAPGLTRTSGQRVGAPSRDRRSTSPCAVLRNLALRRRRQSSPQRRRRCGSSITKRSAGTAISDSRQARRRVSVMAAGIVAASMARRCQDKLKK